MEDKFSPEDWAQKALTEILDLARRSQKIGLRWDRSRKIVERGSMLILKVDAE